MGAETTIGCIAAEDVAPPLAATATPAAAAAAVSSLGEEDVVEEAEGEEATEEGGDDDDDCPLCLLPLGRHDDIHPLQCPSRHCHFNCCVDCLERMIKSTGDSIEASDGNTFRVFLHCPNCRSNLGPSIRDTVLLRKVDKYSHEHEEAPPAPPPPPPPPQSDSPSSVVIISELSWFKRALEKDGDLADAIEGARRREDEFFGRDHDDHDHDDDGVEEEGKEEEGKHSPESSTRAAGRRLGSSIGRRGSSLWSFVEEEGIEADLTNGPHNSFIYRHHSMIDMRKVMMTKDGPEDRNPRDNEDDVEADTTLLFGLEAFMTERERRLMTAHLISGDASRLAAAAEMTHYVSALSRQGMKPGPRRSSMSMTKSKMCVLDSIREVIREGNDARRREEEEEEVRGGRRQQPAVVVGVEASRLDAAAKGGRRNLTRLVEMENKMRMEYMMLHPIPLRMPKYAEVDSINDGGIQVAKLAFVDDTWDGTILDAFSKISVHKRFLARDNYKITKQSADADSVGIRCVIDAGEVNRPHKNKSNKGYIDTVRPRVIVASINRELGQQGVVRGDVVTHFNGEEFTGTASELMTLLAKSREEDDELLTFVFNADSAVAEALKRRSMISDY